jgi:hypothetical protein
MKMLRGVVVVMGGLLMACADFEGVTGTGGLPNEVVEAPLFSRDVLPIVERRCGVGGCHSEGTHQAGLVLTHDSAYRALVNQPSRTRGGQVLVRPGDAANSWMVIAIQDNAERRQGLPRMPLGSGPLTPNQIQTIINWINRGAPND